MVGLAGCGSTTTTGGSSPTTLTFPFAYDMPSGADPDLFYDGEGLQLTTEVYQGLVRYANDDTSEIVGDLASSWTVSKDGRVYAFKLRRGVKFHDGTPFDAEAMKASFARRGALKGGPAYMVAGVESMRTPDPTTFVVTLKERDAAFVSHLASGWGPKAISPTAVREHKRPGDPYAKQWLRSHSAGTGPYRISEFRPGQRYVLTAFPDYVGPKAQFKTINIPIVPDINTQLLKLESGELSMVTHVIPEQSLEQMSSNRSISLSSYPSNQRHMVFLNAATFTSAQQRRDLLAGLDLPSLYAGGSGLSSAPVRSFYPTGGLQAGDFSAQPDPAALERATSAIHQTLDIGALAGSKRDEEAAKLVQVQLQKVGVQAKIRTIPASQSYSLPTKPSLRPDILVGAIVPDDLAPDSFIRIFFHSEGSVNWLGCSSKQADDQMDAGLKAPTPEESDRLYVAAAESVIENGCGLPVAEINDVVATRSDLNLTNLQHAIAISFALRLELLRTK
jgi:peptide/nickel transport system substrate-binding protein